VPYYAPRTYREGTGYHGGQTEVPYQSLGAEKIRVSPYESGTSFPDGQAGRSFGGAKMEGEPYNKTVEGDLYCTSKRGPVSHVETPHRSVEAEEELQFGPRGRPAGTQQGQAPSGSALAEGQSYAPRGVSEGYRKGRVQNPLLSSPEAHEPSHAPQRGPTGYQAARKNARVEEEPRRAPREGPASYREGLVEESSPRGGDPGVEEEMGVGQQQKVPWHQKMRQAAELAHQREAARQVAKREEAAMHLTKELVEDAILEAKQRAEHRSAGG